MYDVNRYVLHLSIVPEIATSPSFGTAPRNDSGFRYFPHKISCFRVRKECHCEPVRTLVWQSVPTMRGIVLAQRANNITPANDHLHFPDGQKHRQPMAAGVDFEEGIAYPLTFRALVRPSGRISPTFMRLRLVRLGPTSS